MTPRWKRVALIRHARWLHHRIRVARWHAFWLSMGRIPQAADFEFLDDVWKGRA